MPSEADRQIIIEAFKQVRWPRGQQTLEDAWLGIYQLLAYYQPKVNRLHIIEANELRKSRRWRERAERAEQHIADALGIAVEELPQYVDRMLSLARWTSEDPDEPMQRQNPLGIGFRTLAAHIFGEFGPADLNYIQEASAQQWFPGIQLPGRSIRASIDVLIASGDEPRAVVSCKWGTRHDRSSDPSNECPVYKAAAGFRNIVFGYYVMTSEFSCSRLEKLLGQFCIDGLIHPRGDLLRAIHGDRAEPTLSHDKFLDLAEFVDRLHTW